MLDHVRKPFIITQLIIDLIKLILKYYVFLFSFSVPPVGGLSSLKVQIPDTILRGQDAVFNCSYTLEDEKLYAVKWYRGTYEIFRYVPSDNPPTKAFPLQGYNVSVSLNNMRTVL